MKCGMNGKPRFVRTDFLGGLQASLPALAEHPKSFSLCEVRTTQVDTCTLQ